MKTAGAWDYRLRSALNCEFKVSEREMKNLNRECMAVGDRGVGGLMLPVGLGMKMAW
jgi:hypothetical protein